MHFAFLTRACVVAALLLAGATQARPLEEQVDLPVQVKDANGRQTAQTIKVTVFSDDANPRPAPVLIINHGRAPDAQGRADLGRARYSAAAQFFVQRGFIVAVPTRVGYGVSGGQDVEFSGDCNRKNYPPGFAAAADQNLAVIEMLRQRTDVAKDRLVLMGQSYGGATAVALAARNPPGVVAAINLAGGSGGNPQTSPQQPCAPQLMERLFRTWGKTAKVPMLWLYTQNDRYFGATYPRQWFDAYIEANTEAEFVQFPPHGEDGHSLFTRFPEVWQPRVVAFLEAQGFGMQFGSGVHVHSTSNLPPPPRKSSADADASKGGNANSDANNRGKPKGN